MELTDYPIYFNANLSQFGDDMGLLSSLFTKKNVDIDNVNILALAISTNAIKAGLTVSSIIPLSGDNGTKNEQQGRIDMLYIYFLLHIAAREYRSMFGRNRNVLIEHLLPATIEIYVRHTISKTHERLDSDKADLLVVIKETVDTVKGVFAEYDSLFSKCDDITSSEINLYSEKSLFLTVGQHIYSQTDQKLEVCHLSLLTMLSVNTLKDVGFPDKLAAIGG